MKEDEIIGKLKEIIDCIKIAKPVLNVRETALLTGYSPAHLYKLVCNREIPHYKRGKTLFFKREEILAWMTENKVEVVE